jgi:lipopolysaccharide biosynthesis glycosyltransferase
MLRIFIGYDARQPVSFNVLQQSIISRSSKPVAITPLVIEQLPIKRVGLTPFTFSRFLVPYLCDFQGWALFLDIDMLVRDDIASLFELADDRYAAMVSKNEKKFEWASAILFNCEKNTILKPDYIERAEKLHHIAWLKEEEIGDLPREWNHLVGYDEPLNDAKLVHYTQGIPCFPETITSEYVKEWHEEHKKTNSSLPWEVLMGNSIHATIKDGKRVPKFVAGEK